MGLESVHTASGPAVFCASSKSSSTLTATSVSWNCSTVAWRVDGISRLAGWPLVDAAAAAAEVVAAAAVITAAAAVTEQQPSTQQHVPLHCMPAGQWHLTDTSLPLQRTPCRTSLHVREERRWAIGAKHLWHPLHAVLQHPLHCTLLAGAACLPAAVCTRVHPISQLQCKVVVTSSSASLQCAPKPRMRTLANDFLHLQILKVHSPGPGTSKGEARQSVNRASAAMNQLTSGDQQGRLLSEQEPV